MHPSLPKPTCLHIPRVQCTISVNAHAPELSFHSRMAAVAQFNIGASRIIRWVPITQAATSRHSKYMWPAAFGIHAMREPPKALTPNAVQELYEPDNRWTRGGAETPLGRP